MKQSRYSESKISEILTQAQDGVPVADLCHEYGMSSTSFYKSREKYG